MLSLNFWFVGPIRKYTGMWLNTVWVNQLRNYRYDANLRYNVLLNKYYLRYLVYNSCLKYCVNTLQRMLYMHSFQERGQRPLYVLYVHVRILFYNYNGIES